MTCTHFLCKGRTL